MDGIPLRDGTLTSDDPAIALASATDASGAEQRILQAVDAGEGLTRADLTDVTGLPRSTVSALVRKLVASGAIEEFNHANSTGGRRPTLLRTARSTGAAYVAELGQHHARIGIVTLSGSIVATQDIALDIAEGQETTVDLLASAWLRLSEQHPLPVSVVGLCVPGPVDDKGRITGAARMAGWNGLNLVGALEAATGLPAVVENDARAAAIGEWSARGEHRDSCIYIKAGTGVGAGWISGGIAHRGTHGFAGDLTHIRIQSADPRPCSCGNSGCLETVASGAAILRQLKELGSPISTPNEVISTANSGDPMVTALVREAGARLGEVLSGLVNFLNPKRIVIGGSMSQMGALLAGLRTELYDRCLPMATDQLSIETSKAGADAPLIGMSILARQMLAHQQRKPK